MKTYFVKYLPVKGEIEEGELCESHQTIFSNNHSKQYIKESWHEIVTYSKHGIKTSSRYDTIELQKVKLFLCSRDIQIGDKVMQLHPNSKVKQPIYPEGEYILEKYTESTFKVIGKISPGATWIKEGDEFDREDVQSLYKGKIQLLPIYEHDYHVTLLGSRKQKEAILSNLPVKEYIAFFRCPVCKDFH